VNLFWRKWNLSNLRPHLHPESQDPERWNDMLESYSREGSELANARQQLLNPSCNCVYNDDLNVSFRMVFFHKRADFHCYLPTWAFAMESRDIQGPEEKWTSVLNSDLTFLSIH
jgi:hypothetical protein